MLVGLATWVIVGHSERRRDAAETDELIGRKLGRARRRRPAPDPVRRRAARGARGRRARRRSSIASCAAPSRGHGPGRPPRRGPGHRLRAGLGDRHRPQRERPGRGGDGRTRSGPCWPGSAGPTGPRRRPGPVRRQRHLGQHRRVPRRAVDRRRARRRRLAQARRDGRDRGTGRPDRRRPAARAA